MHQILSEVSNLEAEAELITVLNNPAPLDNTSIKDGITINDMTELFETEQFMESESHGETSNLILQIMALKHLMR